MGKRKVECKKSPDGEHCWHIIYTTWNKVKMICCWCGETYEEDILTSFSITTKEHGPHYQLELW